MIEQLKTKPQEMLEGKMNKQIETFSFNPPIILSEEEKWMLAVTSFEPTISVFLNDENNSFSITTPSYWTSRGGSETNTDLREFLELREEKDILLHVKEDGKRRNLINIRENEYKLSDLDTRKNEITEELKNAEYNDI